LKREITGLRKLQNLKLGVMRNACKILVGKPGGTDGVDRLDAHGMIKLRWIFTEIVGGDGLYLCASGYDPVAGSYDSCNEP
jgi:hypothetical protein